MGPVITRDRVEHLIAEQRLRLVELLQCTHALEHTHHPIEATSLYDRLCFLRDDVPLRADQIIAAIDELDEAEQRTLFRWHFGTDTESLMRGLAS